jgi:hypothetical protein
MDREEKRVRKDMEGENRRWIRSMGSRKSTIEMGKRLKWEIGLEGKLEWGDSGISLEVMK